jgi:hypothetical protein
MAAAFLVALLGCLIYLSSSKGPVARPKEKALPLGGGSGDPRDVAGSLPAKVDGDVGKIKADTIFPAVEKQIARVVLQLKNIEKENSYRLQDFVANGNETVVTLIRQPSPQQMSRIRQAMTVAIDSFADDSPENSNCRKQVESLLNEYTVYPKQFKVLDLQLSGENKTFFTMFYVDDAQSAKISDNGLMHLPGDSSVMMDSEDWASDESWAGKRYGHLLELETLPDAKAGASK